jgi:hypothetical protein
MSRGENRIPGPRAIDPISGFDIPHENLVRQWDGEFVDRRFADKRNPQDFVRGRPERIALPNARPEPPEVYMACNIMMEDGVTPILQEDGTPLMTEGEVVTL